MYKSKMYKVITKELYQKSHKPVVYVYKIQFNLEGGGTMVKVMKKLLLSNRKKDTVVKVKVVKTSPKVKRIIYDGIAHIGEDR